MTRMTRREFAAAPLALAAAHGAAAAPRPRAPATAWPDATEVADLIRRREITAAEAVEAAIVRAEALQPILNPIVNSDFDRALDKARAETPAGPLGGVPFLVKDLEDYRGLPTRAGSRALAASPPASTQIPYMDAFDRAGLVTLGKSATPEFGLLPSTEPLATGATRNPWDLARSPGGSSGGTAAAVASVIVTVGHGTDGGGSLRIPASHCGLFGLKPSRGRMIGTRGETKVTDFAVQHVLSRSVRDSAALFALTEDAQPGARHAPVGLVTAPNRRRLRVGLLIEDGLGHSPAPEVIAATESAGKLLQSLGHHVEPTRWPIDGARFIQDFLLLWASDAARTVEAIAKATGHPPDETMFEPFTLGLVEMFRSTPASKFAPTLQGLEAAALAYDTWFPANQLDVVISPVVSTPPPLTGEIGPSVPFETLVPRLIAYVGYTPLHNIAGAPAMSVPLYWTEAGLPIGTQIAARAGQERLLFELALQLEQARPWAQRAPGVHALSIRESLRPA